MKTRLFVKNIQFCFVVVLIFLTSTLVLLFPVTVISNPCPAPAYPILLCHPL